MDATSGSTQLIDVGRRFRSVLPSLAFVLVLSLRVLLLIALRLVRPVIMVPLILAVIGGMCSTLGFLVACWWHDAARAATATLVAAAALGFFAKFADLADPGHFERRGSTWRSPW